MLVSVLEGLALPSLFLVLPSPLLGRLALIIAYCLSYSFAHTIAAGELNAHLTERFAGSAYPMDNEGTSNPRMNPMPSSGANGSNDDIRKYFEAPKTAPIGGNWLQKPEMPTPAEILLDPANYRSGEQLLDIAENLRPNKIEGAYDSNEEYLGTHYDLLREDSIRPLREAVEQVRASPYLDEAEYSGGSIGIYDPVSHVHVSNHVCAHYLLRSISLLSSSRIGDWLPGSHFP